MVRRMWPTLAIAVVACVAAACSDDDDDAAALAAYCDKAKAAEALEAEFAAQATPDPAQLEADYTAFVAAVQEAAAATPEAIRSEMAANAEAVEALRAIFEANGYDAAAASQDPAMTEFLQNDAFETAGKAVDDFNQRECGITAT